jgi:hypothetical protein
MDRNKLDIVICGSSRSKLLPYCIDSIRKYIISQSRNTDFRIIVHEDFVNPTESEKTVKWCENNGVDVILKSNPAIGYGKALHNIINNHVKSEYMINIQDDWEFERTGIDIDRIIWTMKTHKLWSIVFHKYPIKRYKGDHFNKEYDYDGLKLVLCNGWRMIPSVWNTSIVKSKFPNCHTKPESGLINSFGDGDKRQDIEYCLENVRSYYFGGVSEPRWVKHIGNTWRKRNFSNRYDDGCIEWDILDLRDKPFWVPYYTRPMNIKWCEKDPVKLKYFYDLLAKFPENIRKEFLK